MSVVIPDAAQPRSGIGLRHYPRAPIPGSIADEASDGPGMTTG
jgi:hypothetical protein